MGMIEGLTGEWSCFVCSKTTYAESLPAEIRGPATRWLRVHAEYDDTHPWEALDIIATLLGHAPSQSVIDEVRRAIRASYVYMEMAADHAMLAAMQPSVGDYESRLEAETHRVFSDANATAEDRRWAETYDYGTYSRSSGCDT